MSDIIPMFLILGGREDLDSDAAVQRAATMLLVAFTAHRKANIMIAGFDDDPRPVWECPGVASFLRRVFAKAHMTDWRHGLALLDQSSMAVAMKCGVFPGAPVHVTIRTGNNAVR